MIFLLISRGILGYVADGSVYKVISLSSLREGSCRVVMDIVSSRAVRLALPLPSCITFGMGCLDQHSTCLRLFWFLAA